MICLIKKVEKLVNENIFIFKKKNKWFGENIYSHILIFYKIFFYTHEKNYISWNTWKLVKLYTKLLFLFWTCDK